MEQQCSNSELRPRSEVVIREDLISKLPDEIIVRILCLLTAEHSIPTCILSKRWKSIWKDMPKLVFYHKHHKQGFLDNVLSALLTHRCPVLHYLKISTASDCDTDDLANWCRIAFLRNISELVLMLNNVPQWVLFPATVLSHTNTLTTLKLYGYIMLSFPDSDIRLTFLKKLHLCNVMFQDDGSLSRFLHGCPSLQELVIFFYIRSGVETIHINIPSLQRLTLRSCCFEGERLVIRCPQLKYLNIRLFDGVDTCRLLDATEIIEAKFAEYEYSSNIDENILESITTVEHLTMCSSMKFFRIHKLPTGKLFYSLLTLELTTRRADWCNLLSSMLRLTPNLQVLKLVGGTFRRGSPTWVVPKRAPKCFFTSLKTLVWTEYIWDGEDDHEVAKYILQNASQLEEATFVTFVHTHYLMVMRDERLSELTTVVRPSTLCQLVFAYKPYGESCEGGVDSDMDEFLDDWENM